MHTFILFIHSFILLSAAMILASLQETSANFCLLKTLRVMLPALCWFQTHGGASNLIWPKTTLWFNHIRYTDDGMHGQDWRSQTYWQEILWHGLFSLRFFHSFWFFCFNPLCVLLWMIQLLFSYQIIISGMATTVSCRILDSSVFCVWVYLYM